MTLPANLQTVVTAVLRDAGDATEIQRTAPVSGGCINQATRLDTGQHSYLLKWNTDPLPGVFTTEARGLELMQATHTVRVPAVIYATDATDEHPAFIILEWLEGTTRTSSAAAQAALGRQLAQMHHTGTAATYGLDHDNWLGSSPQYNGWYNDWTNFYRERRLRPQIDMAARNGALPGRRRQQLERVLERMGEWLDGVERQPALLHGDLWGGNIIPGPGEAPAIIDPAAYYGDREAELAYTQLFGGFSEHFYRAYEETWPLSPGYAERRDLYNLYHLLNHLNIFGESYGSGVDAVAAHYAG
jgi:fructosamine-3-kinase